MNSRVFVLYVHNQRTPANSYRLSEDIQLVKTLGLTVVGTDTCKLRGSPKTSTFIGKGWVEKMSAEISSLKIDTVVIDPDLSSLQQKKLEELWKCAVWDRTALILAIFAQRARTAAGKLQVELAQLLYEKSRLIGAWGHLERQKGGFGFMGGPGESQLEIDRRLIRNKIIKIQKQLEKVRKTRELHRKSRGSFPVVTLVGYTNAGKSSLFRKLTRSEVLCADMPFATLDPTLRKVYLPSSRSILLTDTVGFISELPSFLKLAFQATLEEIWQSDLLLHVQDIAAPNASQQKQDVVKLLEEMKCDVPVLDVLNKIDLLKPSGEEVGQTDFDLVCGVRISALSGQGLPDLLSAIDMELDRLTPAV